MRLVRLLPFLIFCFLAIGCATVYVPNARNATLFDKKGEYKATAFVWQTLDVQLAYAVNNHIGLMANGSTNVGNNLPRYRFGELGIGYFTKIKDYHIEFFGGYGLGSATGNGIGTFAQGDYYRVFCSQAVGQKLDKFHWSFINRISLVDFTQYQTNQPIPDKASKVFVEPALYGSYGIVKEKLFVTTQLGVSVHTGSSPYFDYDPLFFSVGLNYQFGKSK
jgi:hypothetical protein